MGAVDVGFQKSVATPVSSELPCSALIPSRGNQWYEFQQQQNITVNCETVVGGTLEAPKPQTGDLLRNGSGGCSVNSSAQRRIVFDTMRAVINVPLV